MKFPSLWVVTYQSTMCILFAISLLYYYDLFVILTNLQKELVTIESKYVDLYEFRRKVWLHFLCKSYYIVEILHKSNIFFWICTKSLSILYCIMIVQVGFLSFKFVLIKIDPTSTNWSKISFFQYFQMPCMSKSA